ncbi:MAG: hypothetical protein LBG47_04640 [Prevotellaceae bacterium]|jgi:hypothetical protein|nr:hypothetical protein [Prevotellaceae bacterium]
MKQPLFTLLFALLLPVALRAQAAVQPYITKHPAAATYAKGAPARFYVSAYSPNDGYLTYQWYRSKNFGSPFTLSPDGGYTPEQKNQIKAGATPLPEGDKAILATTTPTDLSSPSNPSSDTTTFCYYWVNIKNTKDNATDSTESEFALAKIVNRTLESKLMNGDFQTYDTTGFFAYDGSIASGVPTACWGSLPLDIPNTKMPYWNTTHDGNYAVDNQKNVHLGKVAEIQWVSSDNKVAATNKLDTTGHAQTPNSVIKHEWARTAPLVAELSVAMSSSLYQEVATVPGKIYEWGLDFSAYNAADVTELLAVIIGPAINDSSDYQNGVTNRWRSNITYTLNKGNSSSFHAIQPGTYTWQYPYGYNTTNSFFQDIVNSMELDNNLSNNNNSYASLRTDLSGKQYIVRYNGANYYVKFVADKGYDNQWTHMTGTYTVPTGQGTTVFGFVSICAYAANGGNILDNVLFASGTPPTTSSDIAYSGETALSAATRAGYAYGIAEVRGSTVIALSSPQAGYDPDGSGNAAEVGIAPTAGLGVGGWYAAWGEGDSKAGFGAGGVITFRGLTPSKTYRIVGVPAPAVDTALHANESPVYVLDDGYYRDARMPIAYQSGDDDLWMSSIGVEVYRDASDDSARKVRISVHNASAELEYALLADSVLADGRRAPATAGPALPATGWKQGSAGVAVFEGLALDTTYYLVARAAGYAEVTYAAAAYASDTAAYIAVRTPAPDVRDVAPSNVLRDSCTVIRVATVEAGHRYAVANPATGRMVGVQIAESAGDTLRFPLPESSYKTPYQVMTNGGTAGGRGGGRAYGCPDTFRVDFFGETVKSDATPTGHIPAEVEYHLAAADSALTDGWVAGTGARPVLLSENVLMGNTESALNLMSKLDADAKLSYRIAAPAGYAGAWTSPVKQVDIPRRRSAPTTPGGYKINYDAGTESIGLGSQTDSLAFLAAGAQEWTTVVKGGSWSFAEAGWGDGEIACPFSVRFPATAAAFASLAGSSSIRARPQLPPDIYLVDNSNGGVDPITEVTICGLNSNNVYHFKTPYTKSASDSWEILSIDEDDPDMSTSEPIEFGASDTCYLRIASTGNRPASLPVMLQANMLNVVSQPLYNLAYDYGSAPEGRPVYIRNFSAVDTFFLSSLKLAGGNARYSLAGGDSIIAPGAMDSSWVLTPVGGLSAGPHGDTMTISYHKYANGKANTELNGGYPFTITAKVYLSVSKIYWDLSRIRGEIDVSQTKSNALTLKVSQAPPGATLRYYFGSSSAPVAESESAVDADSAATFTFTAEHGLEAGAAYAISVQAKPDDNHLSEATHPYLATGYTAYATPSFGAVAEVDYAGERIAFRQGYSAADYAVGCASCAGRPALPSPAAAGSLTALLNEAANDSLALFIVRKASAPYPASDTGYSDTVAGRPQAPPVDGSTAAHASSGTANDGAIRMAGEFEYRNRASSGDWLPAANATPGLIADDYHARYKAAAGKFASRAALVTVSAITAQPASIEVAKDNIAPGNATLAIAIPPTVNTVGYQWYKSASAEDTTGSTAIDGADSSAYYVTAALAAPTDALDTYYYYYCVVTIGGASTLTSRVATVRVTKEPISISIDTAYLAPKFYDGTASAAVDSVTLTRSDDKSVRVRLALGADYAVDTARFLSASVGGSDTVLLYVRLTTSLKASLYKLANGEKFLLRGQSVRKATPDTLHFCYTPPEATAESGDEPGKYIYSGSAKTAGVALRTPPYAGMGKLRRCTTPLPTAATTTRTAIMPPPLPCCPAPP